MRFEDVLPEMRKGRRARPSDHHDWFELDKMAGRFSLRNALEKEWELEPLPPQTVTITREQLAEALRSQGWNYSAVMLNGHFDKLAAALGFKEGE